MAVFGGSALALAGIGLFGVMAYLVAQRTSELGVRLVLGARPIDVLRLVVGDGMRLVGLGLALGLAGGLLASRALESQLFGVRPWDPLALVGCRRWRSRSCRCWRSRRRPGARHTIDPTRAMRIE